MPALPPILALLPVPSPGLLPVPIADLLPARILGLLPAGLTLLRWRRRLAMLSRRWW
jgi:hypothetical protein